MTTVVGIDPSLSTSGVALVAVDEGRLCGWSVDLVKAAAPDESTVASELGRIRWVAEGILSRVPDSFDLAVIEGPSLGRYTGKADERAGLRWLLIDRLSEVGPVAVVPPRTRALLAAGNGNARKAVVLDAVRSWAVCRVPDDNAADALALAAAGGFALGGAWPAPMTEKQVSAHARVAWPVGRLVGS